MADNQSNPKTRIKNITFKALKATIKGVLAYAIYFILWTFIAPVAQFLPGLQQMIETFVAVYITLMIIGEFTAGTVYQYFFSAAKTLFVIGYLILSLNGGMIGATFESISLLIDLRLFLVVAMILSLLGLAKSVIQAVNFMNERADSYAMLERA
jgi:hypothetical protein